jgi:uracil-DNA glycosylase
MNAGNVELLSRGESASLLQWWLAAGVDTVTTEEPCNWLKPRAAAEASPAEPAAPASATMPDTLAAFRQWLETTPDLPLARPGEPRALPHGPADAEVMLVSEAPGREDLAAGRPIGGDAWVLVERMLKAIGIAPDAAYSASLSCFHSPAARLDGPALNRCAEILRHHIALVAPKRLLLLGDAPVRALLGQGLAAARGTVHSIGGVQAVATFHPRFLMQRPGDKAFAWRDLLLVSARVEE